jgi:hypothetical protein
MMDELDRLLMLKPPPAEPPGLREAVHRDAGRVQRRRRWFRRGRRVAVLACVYAAGLASMRYWATDVERPRPDVATAPRAVEPAPAQQIDPYRRDPPERLEKWAFLQAGEKRSELYRRAGDGYLGREDVEAALRCYRKALDGGSAADLAVRADSDSWLLMSLKMAKKKERSDARAN